MQTRLVVATAAALCLVALAGCSQPAGSLSMDPVNDTALADRASTSVTADQLADAEERGHRDRVLRRAVDDESVTVAATEPPHDDNETVYRTGDRFYTLSYTAVDTTTGRQVMYRFDRADTPDAAERNGWTVTDYDDLPPVDRAALDPAVRSLSSERLNDSDIPPEGFRGQQVYAPAELNRSAVAGGRYDAVRHEGTLITLDVVSNTSHPMTVYRYRPNRVATGAGPYAACLRNTYGFELDGLDSGARAVVTEATDGTYRAENTSDAAFNSVLDRFHDHAAVSATGQSGSWLVRYDGRLYWADLRYVQFDEYHQTTTSDPPATTCS